MRKRLYRSETDRMLTGVSGGIAEYFDIDPVIVRMLWVLGAIFSGGLLVIAYIVMAIITPTYSRVHGQPQILESEAAPAEPQRVSHPEGAQPPSGQPAAPQAPASPASYQRPLRYREGEGRFGLIVGLAFLVVGGIALLGSFDIFPFWDPSRLWPLILIAIGLAVVYARRRP